MAIFKKLDEGYAPEDVPSVPRVELKRSVRSNNTSVIGPTLVFKGELSADEDLIIEGAIEGTIAHRNQHLTVGEKGRVKADIHANSVIVLGQVVGDIHAEGSVTLAKSANVKGDIFGSRIILEDGARFQGRVDMGETHKATAPPKEKATASPKEPVQTDKAHTEKLRKVVARN